MDNGAEQETVGEALTTAGGGYLVRAEVNGNKWSPQWGATTIEVAEKVLRRIP